MLNMRHMSDMILYHIIKLNVAFCIVNAYNMNDVAHLSYAQLCVAEPGFVFTVSLTSHLKYCPAL